jgi:hypothetical protein
VGFFLQEPVPVAGTEEWRDQVFYLAYCSEGAFDYSAVEEMTVSDRYGFIERLTAQKKKEKAETDKIRAEAKAKRGG